MMEDETVDPAPWQERTTLLLGADGSRKLEEAHVLVVGLGGVGAWAAEMLARAGVGTMTIVDADEVSPSNINRQLVALNSTLGRAKCDVLAERLRDINPAIVLHVHKLFLKDKVMEEVLDAAAYSFVVDAIDSLSPKVFLIKLTCDRGIPIVSSMGAGAKRDASAVHVSDIERSYNCTLARAVRKRLHHLGIRRGVTVVFSTEKPQREAVLAVADEICKRSTTGTVSYMPALFGIQAAAFVINSLAKPTKS